MDILIVSDSWSVVWPTSYKWESYTTFQSKFLHEKNTTDPHIPDSTTFTLPLLKILLESAGHTVHDTVIGGGSNEEIFNFAAKMHHDKNIELVVWFTTDTVRSLKFAVPENDQFWYDNITQVFKNLPSKEHFLDWYRNSVIKEYTKVNDILGTVFKSPTVLVIGGVSKVETDLLQQISNNYNVKYDVLIPSLLELFTDGQIQHTPINYISANAWVKNLNYEELDEELVNYIYEQSTFDLNYLRSTYPGIEEMMLPDHYHMNPAGMVKVFDKIQNWIETNLHH